MLTNPRRLRPASLWSSVVVAALVAATAFAAPRPHAEAAEAGGADSTSNQALTLTLGESKVLTIPGLMRVAIGDAAIANITTAGGTELKVNAVKRGKTTMLVWTKGKRMSYLVTVN
jgi:Flp pilus assembly secretin CpaC